ncbi:MAG: hypothetical protein QOF78_3535 [Phycisphaerales bacterium]|nr:hypothetical protein [Phycisphaerales bacterium]
MALLTAPLFAAKSAAAPKKGDAGGAGAGAASRDAQWTLYCQAIAGPAHVEQAQAVKEQLVQTKMKDWYVLHQDAESVLYYGFYRTISDSDPKDKKEGERAKRDRLAISGMQDQQGNRIFDHVFFVQVAAPDPNAPPEWNLLNATGYFTLQIAAYKDDTKRKEAAVEAVREARAQGIEAYYYHGETVSSVCIGAWPRSAVREQEEETARANDQTQDILVLPTPLPNNEKVDVRNAKGERVKTFAPRFDPIDPSLIATMAKYPTHAVNGVVYVSKSVDPVTQEPKEREDSSYIMRIPTRKAGLLNQPAQAPALLAPPTNATPGGGKLKSLGD